MKKTEGELLKEYSRIIAEADGDPQDWNPEYSDDEDLDGMDIAGANDPEDSEGGFQPDEDSFEEPNMHFNDGEEDVDTESDVEIDSDDPISELADYLDNADSKGTESFSELINKFLKEKNLELTPIGGLTNRQGAV